MTLYRALHPDAQREAQNVAEEKKRLREVKRQFAALRAEQTARKGAA